MRSTFDRPEESAGFLLWQTSMLWQRRVRAALEPLDLTHAQFVLLASATWLERRGAPATQVEIATHAKADVMMTSQVLRTLEGRGLVSRQPSAVDSRAKDVVVTASGRALVGRAIKVVEAVDEAFFEPLGTNRGGVLVAMRSLIEHG
jgi:DNA-binding MarR family transcriptional regulator